MDENDYIGNKRIKDLTDEEYEQLEKLGAFGKPLDLAIITPTKVVHDYSNTNMLPKTPVFKVNNSNDPISRSIRMFGTNPELYKYYSGKSTEQTIDLAKKAATGVMGTAALFNPLTLSIGSGLNTGLNKLGNLTFTTNKAGQIALTPVALKFATTTLAGEGLNRTAQKYGHSNLLEAVAPDVLRDINATIGDAAGDFVGSSLAYGLDPISTIQKIPDAHLGTMFFNNLPYSFMNKVNISSKPINEALLAFVRSNPAHPIEGFEQAKHAYRTTNFKKLRYLASARTPRVETEIIPDVVNSQESGLNLLKKRLQLKQFAFEKGMALPPSNSELIDRFNTTPIKTHLSLQDAYKINRSYGSNKIKSFLETPYTYIKENLEPGVYFNNADIIKINPQYLKALGFNKLAVKAHEMAHSLWKYYTPYYEYIAPQYGPEYLLWFNYRGLPENVVEYLDANEIAARGTQLKNYFGITDNTPITGDMLKYAAKHYVKDTGLNNNMNLFFRGITDWNKAAEWLSKYSYKKGGKICQKKKNAN